MPGQGSMLPQQVPLSPSAQSYALLNMGQALAQAGGPSPYKQSFIGGIGQGAAGFGQGLQQYQDQQMQNELFRMKQEEADLQKKKFGLETKKLEREVASDAAYDAGAAKLPIPQGVDPAAWGSLPAKEKFAYWTKVQEEQMKAPFTGAMKDGTGNWVYDPDYLSGQEQIKRAGRPSVSIHMPKSVLASDKVLLEKGAEAFMQAQELLPLFDVAKAANQQFGQSGMGGGAWLLWEQGKQFLGVPNNAPAGEALKSFGTKMATLQRVPGSGATTDYEMKLYLSSVAGLSTTPQGNELLIAIGEKLTRKKMADFQKMQMYAAQNETTVGYVPDDTPVLTQEEMQTLFSASQGGAAQPTPDPAPGVAPKAGDVQDGFMFKGGDPADKNSWVKVP